MAINPPRGHAIGYDSGAQSEYSLQDYSRKGPSDKTGFQSIWDQNEVVHLALKSADCQNGINILNNDKTVDRYVCTVPYNLFPPPRVFRSKNGSMGGRMLAVT